jgi:hypothetical protein
LRKEPVQVFLQLDRVGVYVSRAVLPVGASLRLASPRQTVSFRFNPCTSHVDFLSAILIFSLRIEALSPVLAEGEGRVCPEFGLPCGACRANGVEDTSGRNAAGLGNCGILQHPCPPAETRTQNFDADKSLLRLFSFGKLAFSGKSHCDF